MEIIPASPEPRSEAIKGRRAQIDPAFAHWFAGFVDGEGSFTVRVCEPREHKGNYTDIDVEFSIILRDDDAAILQEIVDNLGLNARITWYPAMTNHQGVRSNPRAKLSVRRVKNCLRIIEILDKYPLRAKKRNDYKIWREIVLLLNDLPRGNKWHGPADKSHILELVTRLREVRKYAN